jgi:hypothetical protein
MSSETRHNDRHEREDTAVPYWSRLIALAAALLLAPLAAEARDCVRASTATVPAVFDFRFCESRERWTGGFADLPVGALDDPAYGLRFGLARIPPSAGLAGEGLRLAGTNRSDDLFMFAKRRLTGLRPSTAYSVVFRVEIASNAGPGCVGAGGAPGESVYVKGGASPTKPRVRAEDGTLRLNLDTGNQSQRGDDAVVLGNVAAPGAGCDGRRYGAKTLSNRRGEPLFSRTDEEGALWALVGFDSGYEGRSDLYLYRIRVELFPVRR